MDNVRTKVEESDDEMENLAPAQKRGRGRGSRSKKWYFVTKIVLTNYEKIVLMIAKTFEN